MSRHYIEVEADSWFVAHTQSKGVVQYGFAQAPATITSGQHDLEIFATEVAMAVRVDELKGQSGWYDAHKPISVETDIVSNVT